MPDISTKAEVSGTRISRALGEVKTSVDEIRNDKRIIEERGRFRDENNADIRNF